MGQDAGKRCPVPGVWGAGLCSPQRGGSSERDDSQQAPLWAARGWGGTRIRGPALAVVRGSPRRPRAAGEAGRGGRHRGHAQPRTSVECVPSRVNPASRAVGPGAGPGPGRLRGATGQALRCWEQAPGLRQAR